IRVNDTKTIELQYLGPSSRGISEHRFQVIQGMPYIHIPSGDFHSFGWLLIRQNMFHHPSNIMKKADRHEEFSFNDMRYFDTLIYKQKQTEFMIDESDETRKNVAFAEVIDLVRPIEMNSATEVILKIRMCKGFLLSNYRFNLKERYINFNIKKLVKTLLEIQIRLNETHTVPIFIQALRGSNDFGLQSTQYKRDSEIMKQMNKFYSDFYDLQKIDVDHVLHFQPSQSRAFKSIVEKRMTIVWGPPGHGKTHTLALSVLRLIEIAARRNPDSTCCILITAFTHAAIDTFSRKFQSLLDAMRAIKDMQSGEWRSDVQFLKMKDKVDRNTIGKSKYQVVVGTVWSVYKWKDEGATPCFDILVIDEGSQMPVADAAIAFEALKPTASEIRIVVCGDHYQLSPILSAKYPSNTDPSDPKLFGSILECLMRNNAGLAIKLSNVTPRNSAKSFEDDESDSITSEIYGPLTCMLRENFRMVQELCAFSQTLYGGQFEIANKNRQIGMGLRIHQLLKKGVQAYQNFRADAPTARAWAVLEKILGTNERKMAKSLATVIIESESNEEIWTYEDHLLREVLVVVDLVRCLRACFEMETIFVVTPHRAQRSAIKAISDIANDQKITVDTVEKMQGDEADIVVACYGFSDASQLELEIDFIFNSNRLNVALSRAKALGILITTPNILRPPLTAMITADRRQAFGIVDRFSKMS
ncbi:hypothetical protein HK096_005510, partial [Nowakowskiella sp. JEL0078]